MMLRDAGAPEDARSMSRYTLLQLQKQLQAALTGTVSMPFETRAHLMESVARIDEALRADMQRTAL